MLDSFFHMMFKLFCNHIFVLKILRFCQIYETLLRHLFHNVTKICKPLVVYGF